MTLLRRLRVVESGGTTHVNADGDAGMRVAFASNDRRTINQHFGASEGFTVYRVDADQSVLLETLSFARLAQDGTNDKLKPRVEALRHCQLVYCTAIGNAAIRELHIRGIRALRVKSGTAIQAILQLLQSDLVKAALPGAPRIRSVPLRDPGRFDVMEAEGWQE